MPIVVRSGAALFAVVVGIGACASTANEPSGDGQDPTGHGGGGADAGRPDAGAPDDGGSAGDDGIGGSGANSGASGTGGSGANSGKGGTGANPGDGGSPAGGYGGEGGSPDDGGHGGDGGSPTAPIDLRFEGGSVRKAHSLADGALVLIDPPLNLNVDWGFPRRELRAVDSEGHERWHLSSATDRELLDFATHASGEVTALFASVAGFRLVRLDAAGAVHADFALVDAAIDTDLPELPAGVVTGQIETRTHDAGAVAALGEDAVVAVRTARHSVVAHRFAFVDGAFDLRYRTLVVPAYPIGAIGLTGGTYDTFGAVDSQFFVHLALGPDGTTYVGIRHPELSADRLVKVIKDVFGETLATDPDWTDSYVIRLAPGGTRLGTSVVGTERPDEIFALRAVPGGVWALGRNELWNAQGTGFDALVGFVDGASGAATVRSLDVNLGDIAFDAVPLPDGELIVVGASGYAQNPSGASITEASTSFARWLRADGSVVTVPVPTGPRHNEARFIEGLANGHLLVSGMLDGPGTHSADGNLSLLTARGFLTEVTLPAAP